MARKSKLLWELGKNMEDIKFNSSDELEDLNVNVLNNITIHMKNLTDYRADISYQPLENIVMITFISILGNCNEWHEIYEFALIHKDWFSKFLDLKYGIPSVSTIRKTIALVDPEELETICVNFIIEKINELTNLLIPQENKDSRIEKDIISYDGKVCCGSRRNNTINGVVSPVNAMTAFNVTKDIPLATKFIAEKTNEIPTGPELIKLLDLTNTISTFDALNTQKKTIKAIIEQGGDYVGALKGNQHNFYKDVVDYFNDKILYNKAYENCHYEESERAHSCTEKRTYIMTEDIKWLETKGWKEIKSIGICTREYTVNGEQKKDTRYFISSLGTDDINDFCRAVRDEWGIENNLHWQLDVTFKEDQNKTMIKNAQANLNILRKLALNILKLVKPLYNKSLKLIRFRIGQNFEDEINKILLCLNIEDLKCLVNKTQ